MDRDYVVFDDCNGSQVGTYEEFFGAIESLVLNASDAKSKKISKTVPVNLLSDEMILSPISDCNGERGDNSQFSDDLGFEDSFEKQSLESTDAFLEKLRHNNSLQKKTVGLGIHVEKSNYKNSEGEDYIVVPKIDSTSRRIQPKRLFFYLSLDGISQKLQKRLSYCNAQLSIKMQRKCVVLQTVKIPITSINISIVFQDILVFPSDWIQSHDQVNVLLQVHGQDQNRNLKSDEDRVSSNPFAMKFSGKAKYLRKKKVVEKLSVSHTFEFLKGMNTLGCNKVDLKKLMKIKNEEKRIPLFSSPSELIKQELKNPSQNVIATLVLHTCGSS
ncbi:hypothetical protein TPHA_0E00540 [Tetrapisispora phaffii CBS 4417]|uniref:Uncharacterized protein n=1 Tax=Tetrapisispora phaffii (strain ATCC 24235 / CBS 4417 / NBRC 1672 / NRRL Y-8282 / UCD 70-5) TaxID=1071381 RepID=G8BTC1_TETPH|nr:hypothetical protein TPHA_0E00540 [Tetrapisispora phaffii CBS 4417]CCE63149.1 hypothetical protein TPHA_0E00540 [Tetrapisispora phaffii CBS 4417]